MKEKEEESYDGRVTEATVKQMMDYTVILTNDRGDELWRFFDGDDGKRRWKVWAIEPTDRTAIKHYQDARPGADYFDTNVSGPGAPRFLGTDYIVPKKYLMRIAKLLGLKLHRDKGRPLTKERKEKLRQGLERFKIGKAVEKGRVA
jgi:hypothetical protein